MNEGRRFSEEKNWSLIIETVQSKAFWFEDLAKIGGHAEEFGEAKDRAWREAAFPVTISFTC